MPQSPGEMIAAVKANMPAKTGKTFEQWVKIAKAGGPSIAKECYAWLKKEHGLPHLSAQIVADTVSGQGRYEGYDNQDALVDALYAGPKAGLRPIYDQLVKVARKLGKDVVLTPCKTYVSLRRKRQFAIVKPTTRTRVDLGLTLADVKPQGRLEAAGKTGSDRISHVIKIEALKEIDAEVTRWLTEAYERDA
jgi:predicted transport protein